MSRNESPSGSYSFTTPMQEYTVCPYQANVAGYAFSANVERGMADHLKSTFDAFAYPRIYEAQAYRGTQAFEYEGTLLQFAWLGLMHGSGAIQDLDAILSYQCADNVVEVIQFHRNQGLPKIAFEKPLYGLSAYPENTHLILEMMENNFQKGWQQRAFHRLWHIDNAIHEGKAQSKIYTRNEV